MSRRDLIEESEDGNSDSWSKLSASVEIMKIASKPTVSPLNSVSGNVLEDCLLDALKESSTNDKKSSQANSEGSPSTTHSKSKDLDQLIINTDIQEYTETMTELNQELVDVEWVWNWSTRPEVSSPISCLTWQNKMKHYELVNKSSINLAEATTTTTTTRPTNITPTSSPHNNISSYKTFHSNVDNFKIKQSNVDNCVVFYEDVESYKDKSNIVFLLITHACSFFIGVSIAFLCFRRYNESTATYSNIL